MSNDTNVYERLWKLQAMVGKLVLDGKRNAEYVADVLQWIVEEKAVGIVSIFQVVAYTPLPATTGNFVFKENFVVGTSRTAKVKISFVGEDFQRSFGAKIEGPIEAQYIKTDKLLVGARNEEILAALGGKAKAEMTLTEVYAFMKRQASRESGPLFTDGLSNIFYVRDVNGDLRLVDVYWHDDGWCVGAPNILSSDKLRAGTQVFSRNG